MAVPNTDNVVLTNDSAGQRKASVKWVVPIAVGNITASLTAVPIDQPDFPGVIDNIVLVMQGGADTAHNLSLSAVVKKTVSGTTVGVAVATTSPLITFTSGSTTVVAGSTTISTYAAGTGITQVSLKTDGT